MIDITKARAMVERLLGASYALPSDARGWFDHPTAGHVPHNVCTDAADLINALIAEVERLTHTPANEREDLHCVISDLCGQVRDARMQEREACAKHADKYAAANVEGDNMCTAFTQFASDLRKGKHE